MEYSGLSALTTKDFLSFSSGFDNSIRACLSSRLTFIEMCILLNVGKFHTLLGMTRTRGNYPPPLPSSYEWYTIGIEQECNYCQRVLKFIL